MPSVTLTYDLAPAQRIVANLGKALQLTNPDGSPRAATAQEYKDWLRDVTKRMVQGQEMKDAQDALQSPADLLIT